MLADRDFSMIRREPPEVFDWIANWILQCSDQLLLTGAAYAIVLRTSQSCNITTYHNEIVVAFLAISLCIQLIALNFHDRYWQPLPLGILRFLITMFLLGTAATMVFGGFGGTMLFEPYHPDPPTATVFTVLRFLPATCSQSTVVFVTTIPQSDTKPMKSFTFPASELGAFGGFKLQPQDTERTHLALLSTTEWFGWVFFGYNIAIMKLVVQLLDRKDEVIEWTCGWIPKFARELVMSIGSVLLYETTCWGALITN